MTDLKKQQIKNILIRYIFPVILLMYPLIKVNQGVDYTDSMYSLANFRFFPQMDGMWVVATFLANVAGFLIMQLPFAGTYMGMRIYTGLFISAMALISYFWLQKKMPPWLVFIGEVIAIGFCWCPTTILYNYLTYFFMLIALILLYDGLTANRNWKLALAGVFLGINMMVRFPNIIETGFIMAVWLYGFLKKKKVSKVVQETLWCIGGYFVGFGCVFLVIVFLYGIGAYGQMMQSLFTMTDTATSYSPFEMIYACIREYVNGIKWPFFMALYTLVTVVLFQIKKGQYLLVKKGITVVGIMVLFRWFYAKGMFNVNYTTYPSIFQWCTSFTILGILFGVIVLFHKKIEEEQKLLYIIALLVIAITPIGSNNNLFPIFNNLFLIAPITLYAVYHVVRKMKQRDWGFPLQAMLLLVVTAVMIQSIGFGTVFSFRGVKNNTQRDTKIEKNDILKGMYTNQEKAENIEDLTSFCEEKGLLGSEQSFLVFGHIPGVTYFLDTPCAISTSWPDLESYTFESFKKEMTELKSKNETPVIIVNSGIGAYYNQDEEAMTLYEKTKDDTEAAISTIKEDKKIIYLIQFMKSENYIQIYANERFRVYQKEGVTND